LLLPLLIPMICPTSCPTELQGTTCATAAWQRRCSSSSSSSRPVCWRHWGQYRCQVHLETHPHSHRRGCHNYGYAQHTRPFAGGLMDCNGNVGTKAAGFTCELPQCSTAVSAWSVHNSKLPASHAYRQDNAELRRTGNMRVK
jgi:hypothetical protein